MAQSVTLWFGVCWRIASGDIRLVDVLVALLKCWWCVQEHVFVISNRGETWKDCGADQKNYVVG